MDEDHFEDPKVHKFYNSFYQMLDIFKNHGCDLEVIREKLNVYVILKGPVIQREVLLMIGDEIKKHHKSLKTKDYSVIDRIDIYDEETTIIIRRAWTTLDEKTKGMVVRRFSRMFNDYLNVKKG